MQNTKFNFKNIKGMLSRNEMKQIKGGSGGDKCNAYCQSDSNCDTTCPFCTTGAGSGGKTCGKS